MYHLRLIVVHVSPKTYCCYVDMRVEESDIQPCPGKYSVLRSTLWERENAGAASENRTHLYTLVNITRLHCLNIYIQFFKNIFYIRARTFYSSSYRPDEWFWMQSELKCWNLWSIVLVFIILFDKPNE